MASKLQKKIAKALVKVSKTKVGKVLTKVGEKVIKVSPGAGKVAEKVVTKATGIKVPSGTSGKTQSSSGTTSGGSGRTSGGTSSGSSGGKTKSGGKNVVRDVVRDVVTGAVKVVTPKRPGITQPKPTTTVTPVQPQVVDVAKIEVDKRRQREAEYAGRSMETYEPGESKEFTISGSGTSVVVNVGGKTYSGQETIPELGGKRAVEFVAQQQRAARSQGVTGDFTVTMTRPTAEEERQYIEEQYKRQLQEQKPVEVQVFKQPELTTPEKVVLGFEKIKNKVKEQVGKTNILNAVLPIGMYNIIQPKDKEIRLTYGETKKAVGGAIVTGTTFVAEKISPVLGNQEFLIPTPFEPFGYEKGEGPKFKPQFISIRELAKETTKYLSKPEQRIYTQEIKDRGIIDWYQPQFEELKSQAFLRSEYGRASYLGDMSFEEASVRFEQTPEAQAINLQYQEMIDTSYRGKPSAASFKLFGIGAAKTVVNIYPKTLGGAVVGAGALTLGLKGISAIPPKYVVGAEVAYGARGLYRAYNPTLTPVQRSAGFVEAGVSGALLGSQGISYLRKGKVFVEPIGEKSSVKTYTFGRETKEVVNVGGQRLETIVYPRQTLMRATSQGSRTVVTTNWRYFLNRVGINVRPIYTGIPTRGIRGVTGLKSGGFTNLFNKTPRQKAFEILTKRNRLTPYQANKLLRYKAPTIQYYNLEKGFYLTSVGDKGARAYGVFEGRIVQPRVLVDKKLNIFTRGATTKSQRFITEKRLGFLRNQPVVSTITSQTNAYVSPKGYLYNTLGQRNKVTNRLFTQFERVKTTNALEGLRPTSVSGAYEKIKYQDLFAKLRTTQAIPVTIKGGRIVQPATKITYSRTMVIKRQVSGVESQVGITIDNIGKSNIQIIKGGKKSVSSIGNVVEQISKDIPTITPGKIVEKNIVRTALQQATTGTGTGVKLTVSEQKAFTNILRPVSFPVLKPTSISKSIVDVGTSSGLIAGQATGLFSLSLVDTSLRTDQSLDLLSTATPTTELRTGITQLETQGTIAGTTPAETTTEIIVPPIPPPPITPPETTPTLDVPPFAPFLLVPEEEPKKKKKKKEEEEEGLFEVFVKRFGKDIKIGKFKTLPSAKTSLTSKLRTTLSASGFIQKQGKKLKVSELGLVGPEFRVSKQEPYRLVEKKERRLKIGTAEIPEILAIRGGTSRPRVVRPRKNKSSNIFGIKSKSRSRNLFGI